MFGYVRPLKGELKLREFERFKAVYCGLCHCLEGRCGFAARFVLNYDFTFLALLLSSLEEDPGVSMRRCIASPLKKKCVLCADPALELAADESVILAWWKLRDDIADDGLIRRVKARAECLFLRRAYNAARCRQPEYDDKVRRKLAELSALEAEDSDCPDALADCFAQLLAASADSLTDEAQRRAAGQLFYHLGRFVYLCDARDDLKKDWQSGAYNPLVKRYGAVDGVLSPESERELEQTAMQSALLALRAMELLPIRRDGGIIENTLSLGLSAVWRSVVEGTYAVKRRRGALRAEH